MRKLLTLLAIALLACAISVQAAPPQPIPPLAWTTPGDRQVSQVIEQDDPFPFVVNPTYTTTKWPWDYDDEISRTTNNGSLASGATVTLTENLYGDAHHYIGVRILSPHPNLTVTLRIASAADDRTFNVVRDDNTAEPESGLPYGWRGCTDLAYRNDSVHQQEIAGSNGGYAVPTTITVTIHNSGAAIKPSRRNATVMGSYQLGQPYDSVGQNLYCPSGYQIDLTGTPLGWPVTGNVNDPIYHYSGLALK